MGHIIVDAVDKKLTQMLSLKCSHFAVTQVLLAL
jgi:hypothetical protein